MNKVPFEIFFELTKNMKFIDIVNLCETNPKWEKYCKSPQFRSLIQISQNEITSSLYPAIINDNIQVVINILNYGIDVNIKNRDDTTPIYISIMYNKYTISKILLKCGADPNTTYNGLKIMMYSIMDNNVQIVELLLKYDADPNTIVDITGVTGLQIACESNYIEMVELLLRYDANPNIQDEYGNTSLFSARNNINILELLLQNDANPNIKNNDGRTVLLLASNDDIINLLLHYGAK